MDWRRAPEPIPEEAIGEEHGADVIVVGLGYSGSAALRAAAEAGCSVIGLERQRRDRYQTFGRDFGHINSAFLASREVLPVDPMELFEEWMRRAGGRANPELVRSFCEKSGEAFDWYTDKYGPEGLKDVHVAFWPGGAERFKEAVRRGENGINGYRYWYGSAQFPDPAGWPGGPTLPECAMANLCKGEQSGAVLRFAEKANRLLTDNGRVTGVITSDEGGVFRRYRAEKAVILAAGDFSGSEEMVRELCPDVSDVQGPVGHARGMGRSGDGHRLGVWAGGRLESRPLPVMGGNGLVPMGMCNFASVWFDESGRRFCNELFGGPEIAGLTGNQDGIREIWAVFDEHALENELTWAVPCHGGFDANIEGAVVNLRKLKEHAYAGGAQPYEAQLKMPLGRQRAFYGRTPEELAENAGIRGAAAERLCEGIRRYNGFAEAGADMDFGRDAKTLDPLTDMLFLQRLPAVPMGPMLVTVGGLLTDGRQRVLDEAFRPIPGLFATGNCCGRRFGAQYSTPISGVSIGMAVTLGREAGLAAAGADKEKEI